MENKKRREFLKASGIVLGGLIITAPLAALAQGTSTSGNTTGPGKKGTGSTNTTDTIDPIQTGTGTPETSRGFWSGYYQGGYSNQGYFQSGYAYSGYYQGMYY